MMGQGSSPARAWPGARGPKPDHSVIPPAVKTPDSNFAGIKMPEAKMPVVNMSAVKMPT